MAPCLLKTDIEALHGRGAGRDLGDADPRPDDAILTEVDRDVAHRAEAVVADGHLERDNDAGSGHPADHRQTLEREIATASPRISGPHISGAIDKPHLGAVGGELPDDRHGVVGGVPLRGAEIAHHPHHPRRLRSRAVPKELGRGGQGSQRPGIGGRGFHRRQFVADPLDTLRGHRLPGDIDPSGHIVAR